MTDEYVERAVRRTIDYWVLSPSNHSKRLHLPDPDASEADPSPRCLTGTGDGVTVAGEWTAKGVAVYPEGYRPLCRRCLQRVNLIPRIPVGRPGEDGP